MCGPATISTMFFIKNEFDKLFDQFVSTSNMEEDLPLVNQICDIIKRGDVQPKYVVGQIKKKSTSGNSQVALYALFVLDYCVKNCDDLLIDEIASEASLQQLRSIVKSSVHLDIKNKLLELLWSWAYEYRSKHKTIHNSVNTLRSEGCKFPEVKGSDPLFLYNTAPEWTFGSNCTSCEAQFGVILRRHHCRACGNVFCGHCSSKTCSLPRFGIEKEVRVCDTCFIERSKFEHVPISCPNSEVNDSLRNNADGSVIQNIGKKEFEEVAEAEMFQQRSFEKGREGSVSDPQENDLDYPQANIDSINHVHHCKVCTEDYVCYCSDPDIVQESPVLKSIRLCDKCSRKHCVPLISSIQVKKKKSKEESESLFTSSSDEDSESDIDMKNIRRELKIKKKILSSSEKNNSLIYTDQSSSSQDDQSSFNYQDHRTGEVISSTDSAVVIENGKSEDYLNEFINFGKLVADELKRLPYDKAIMVQREMLLILSKVKINESFC